MAQPEFFKEAFQALAHDGCIGDPQGEEAYAYLRVSSAGQADEGRSGLPRQVQHCHEIALEKGVKIPWELVFADDHSGFEFRDRPELGRLRDEYKTTSRRARIVVMEYLDRLSRNADWHQGFILDEMKEFHLQVLFWKTFNSRVERAVMGAISQEGMEQAKQRMAEGNLFKAKDKRVTARVPAYGYQLVDRFGVASEAAKKDSHYGIHPEQAPAIQEIFQKVGMEGWSLRRLAKWLDDLYTPGKRFKRWEPKMLGLMIRNPLYKGEFIAHRYTYVKVAGARQQPNRTTKMVWKKIERPEEEWIRVPVPPIVSIELWEIANRMLDKNAQTGRRAAKEPYLLTGLLKCASCGYSYIGRRKIFRKKSKEYLGRYYRDSSAMGLMGKFRDIHCKQGQISCKTLDSAVWKVISDFLTEPQTLIDSMDREYASGPNAQLQSEIEYLRGQLAESASEDEDLYQAYRAKAFDAGEFAARRETVKERRKKLNTEVSALEARVLTREKLELNKQRVLLQAAGLRERGLTPNPSFEVKQTILKTVVEKIRLNVDEGWFEIEGILPGHCSIDDSIACIPVDMDSLPPAAKSSRGMLATPAPAKLKRCVLPPRVGASPLDFARQTLVIHPETKHRDAPTKSHRDGAISHHPPNPHVKSCDAAHGRGAYA